MKPSNFGGNPSIRALPPTSTGYTVKARTPFGGNGTARSGIVDDNEPPSGKELGRSWRRCYPQDRNAFHFTPGTPPSRADFVLLALLPARSQNGGATAWRERAGRGDDSPRTSSRSPGMARPG